MNTRQPQFENRNRRSQAIFGWVVVLLWLLATISVLIALANARKPYGQRWVEDGEKMAAPAIVFGLLALATPIGYFMLVAEANRVDELAHQFRSGRQLARWTVSPDVAKRYRAYLVSHQNKKGVPTKSSDKVEVFVGQGGAYIDGEFLLWGTAGRQLAAVSVVTPPGTGLMLLEFTIAINGYGQVTSAPLPAGSEAAANRLAKALLIGDRGGWATDLSTAGLGLVELFR